MLVLPIANCMGGIFNEHFFVKDKVVFDTIVDERMVCDSLRWIDGNLYTNDTVLLFVHASPQGNDSTMLYLTVNHSTTGDTTAVECDSFSWHGFEYRETPDTAPTFRYQTYLGCDSVVTLHLTINKSVSITVDSTICAELLPFVWNDSTFYEAGEKIVTLTTSNNCDSIVTMHLTVNTTPDEPNFYTKPNEKCSEQNGTIVINSPAGDDISYSIDGESFQEENEFLNLKIGLYTLTVRNGNGCVITTDVVIEALNNTIDSVAASANTPCEGDDLQLTGYGYPSSDEFTYKWEGPNFTSEELSPTISNANSEMNGIYILTVTGGEECFRTAYVNVNVNTPAFTLANIDDKTVCAGDTVTLNAVPTSTSADTITVTYSWTGPNNFTSDQQNITIDSITAEQAGEYTVTATDQ